MNSLLSAASAQEPSLACKITLLAEDVALMQQMCYGVVSHVDGTVRQGLDEIHGIPRKSCSEPKGSGARPLMKPFEHMVELVSGLI